MIRSRFVVPSTGDCKRQTPVCWISTKSILTCMMVALENHWCCASSAPTAGDVTTVPLGPQEPDGPGFA